MVHVSARIQMRSTQAPRHRRRTLRGRKRLQNEGVKATRRGFRRKTPPMLKSGPIS